MIIHLQAQFQQKLVYQLMVEIIITTLAPLIIGIIITMMHMIITMVSVICLKLKPKLKFNFYDQIISVNKIMLCVISLAQYVNYNESIISKHFNQQSLFYGTNKFTWPMYCCFYCPFFIFVCNVLILFNIWLCLNYLKPIIMLLFVLNIPLSESLLYTW